jgi:nucleoside-diphosphate-sugar epimerase
VASSIRKHSEATSGTVLVTGGAGVVGTPLVARLPEESTVCLVHESPLDSPGRTVTGDLTKPRLGLARGEYAALTREVECVVHSGAATRFDSSREEYFALNVDGTCRVLEFAADASARLIHTSTAFVEAQCQPPSGFLDPAGYVESKAEAEKAVRSSGVDAHVVRPSVVLPRSANVDSPHRQGFQYFIRALLNEHLPVVPSDEETRLDFVAAELVAEVLALMVTSPPPGELSFLTAGQDAWTVRMLIERLMAIFAEEGRRVVSPRLAPQEMFERLLKPGFYDELPSRYVRRFERMDSIGTVLLIPRPYPSTLDSLAQYYGQPLRLDLDETFRMAVKACLATEPQPVA